jgi:ferredoxin
MQVVPKERADAATAMPVKAHAAAWAKPTFRSLRVPLVVLAAFLGIALWGWLASGYVQPLFMFGYIGMSLATGLGLYALAPKRQKPNARRLTLVLVGGFLLFFAVVIGVENTQIEGFFFGVLGGVVQMAVIHYFIAKIFGPLLFGRLWCGWACWTVMVLDLLPFKRPHGRVPGHWGRLRYVHFALSASLVLALFYGFGYRSGATGRQAVIWFLAGNALYYALGIGLAVALRDNRAFCKYACPVAVPLGLTSRFSLLKVAGDATRCNDCDACERTCPMDVRISDYVLSGRRVLSTECSLCQTCITVCPRDALKLTFGFDVGGSNLLSDRVHKQRLHSGSPAADSASAPST